MQFLEICQVESPAKFEGMKEAYDTVDGSEIRRENHLGMVVKPVVNHGISTTNLNFPDFWTINSIIYQVIQAVTFLPPSWRSQTAFERVTFSPSQKGR